MGNVSEAVTTVDGIKALLDAGGAIGVKVIEVEGACKAVVIPERYRLQPVEMLPDKVERAVQFSDVESFATYVNKYQTPGTLIFATVTETECTLTAHLDYHEKPTLEATDRDNGWSSHTARLVCVQTKEWKTWSGNNSRAKNPFKQEEFAQFLEDNDRILRSPDAAGLLELVTTLEGKKNVRFNSAIKLQNGKAKLDYEEDIQLRGGVENGQIEVPTELICAIIPFENGPEPYAVKSRLRYRIESRQIVFWYEVIAPHLILKEAAGKVMDAVRDKVKVPLLIGG